MIIKGKEVKVIKEYEKFYLVEFPLGYRECINKFDLRKGKEKRKPMQPRLIDLTKK